MLSPRCVPWQTWRYVKQTRLPLFKFQRGLIETEKAANWEARPRLMKTERLLLCFPSCYWSQDLVKSISLSLDFFFSFSLSGTVARAVDTNFTCLYIVVDSCLFPKLYYHVQDDNRSGKWQIQSGFCRATVDLTSVLSYGEKGYFNIIVCERKGKFRGYLFHIDLSRTALAW